VKYLLDKHLVNRPPLSLFEEVKYTSILHGIYCVTAESYRNDEEDDDEEVEAINLFYLKKV